MTVPQAASTLRAPGVALARRGVANPIVRLLIGIVPILVVIILYELLAGSKDRPRIFPDVARIGDAFFNIVSGEGELGNAYMQILATSMRLIAAFVVAFTLGISIGIAAGRNNLVFSFVENLVWVFMAVPSVVWVYLFAVGLGLSPLVPIGAVAALLMPQFVVLVAEGAKSVPTDLVEMARSYKVSTRDRLTGLFLPFLVPYITSASRTAFALAVKIMLIAEVIGQPDGIGFEVSYWYGRLFMGPIIAWALTMIILGLLVDNLLFGPIERRVSQWKSKPVQQAGVGGVA